MTEILDIKLKLQTLPEKPGVYQYFDKSGVIIYVGKAKNLKKRVGSYFTKNHENYKTSLLVKKICDIHYIVVDTEVDALLLENNLIKKYQPRYNIQLKDDKTFPWICISNEAFPRISTTRRVIKNGAKYFGPYPNLKVMYTMLDLIKQLFKLRTCQLDLSANKIEKGVHKVCLEYHIGNCKAPCVGKQTHNEYDGWITEIEDLLKGNISVVISLLKQKMLEHSAKYEFEEAQELKERIEVIERYKARSTIVSPTVGRLDVLTLVDDTESVFVNYLVVLDGAIIHGYTSEIQKKLDESPEDIISFVLPEMRERYQSISREVLVQTECSLALQGVDFFVPQRGDKKHLLDLSLRNATFYRIEKLKQEKIKDPDRHVNRILETLQKDLHLKELPTHIECFDNSNIQGTHPVSACVVFKNAKPSKKDYRHFNVKTVVGPDDFATMTEALTRRYKRLVNEGEALPQLIIIDGGKGQLSAALDALDALNLRGKMAIVGVAKRLEEIYFPGDSIPLYLDKRSESLKLIQQLRDEAHRFGITHHRNRRSKSALVSELTQIEGIGPKTQQDLMLAFKTVSLIKEKTEEELANIIGFSKAKIVWGYFH